MLELRKIGLRKGAFALRQVSLAVPERDYFVILGRTGSGKTLLLETIAGLHRHTGAISFRGREITGVPPERRRVGFVYQDFALFPHLSVTGNIRFSDRYREQAGRIAWQELIDSLDLGELLERDIRYLSGGEKQRVALARAIYSRPDILLLDEPLSAIDPGFRTQIMENLKDLKRRFEVTVIHVTHNFHEAAYLADRIGIMLDGKLVQQGAVQEVLHRPASIPVARFLGYRNILPQRLIDPHAAAGHFALNAAQIRVDTPPVGDDYSMYGVCRERNEGVNHYELVVEADGCPVVVRLTKQSIDPVRVGPGATVQLSFPRSAVTFFPPAESPDEAPV
ncbi:MAG: sulfate ABC transporter ATP-binding protein [Desulfuromonas sp.]|nr:MAG: sulfate ABC transporter ATP-binding protein [Desulfuromonas sp.]